VPEGLSDKVENPGTDAMENRVEEVANTGYIKAWRSRHYKIQSKWDWWFLAYVALEISGYQEL